jgi:hypothetical protein
MPVELERVYESAMQLSSHDRRVLIYRLNEEAEQELRDTLLRRQEEVDSGKVKCIPAEVVLQRIKDRHK